MLRQPAGPRRCRGGQGREAAPSGATGPRCRAAAPRPALTSQRAAPPPPGGSPAEPGPPRQPVAAPRRSRARPAAPSPPGDPRGARRPSRPGPPFRDPAGPHSLGGVDPDDVEVAVVDALLVFVGVASAAPCSAPQNPAVRLGPAAARHRRRSALLPLLLPQRRRARISARRQGAGPRRGGPCAAGRQEQRSATPRQPRALQPLPQRDPEHGAPGKLSDLLTSTVTPLLGAARWGAVQPRRLGSTAGAAGF